MKRSIKFYSFTTFLTKPYLLIFFIAADYVDGVDTPRGFPGTTPVVQPANKITDELFNVEQQNKGTGDISVMFMTFGQFLDHDLGIAVHNAECNVKE